MSKPTTEAGKRLLAEKGAYTYGPLPSEIAAIEAEATTRWEQEQVPIIEQQTRAAVLRELREEVEGMAVDQTVGDTANAAFSAAISSRDVLAAINRRLAR